MTATFEVDKSGNISLIGTRIGHFDWPGTEVKKREEKEPSSWWIWLLLLVGTMYALDGLTEAIELLMR